MQSWIEARAAYIEDNSDNTWVVQDPVVGHLAAALYYFGVDNNSRLTQKSKQILANKYYRNQARWLYINEQIFNIMGIFRHGDIRVIPLKGVALEWLYTNAGLRHLGDVDILIHEQDYISAAQLLINHGYRLHVNNPFTSIDELEDISPSYLPLEIMLVDEKGLIIEIHRHLITTIWILPAFSIDVDGIWRRAVPASNSISPEPWDRYLSPYDTLAHLCLHEGLHGLQVMHGYSDIDQFIRKLPASWDWECFVSIVEEWKIMSIAYHVLSFCQRFMGTPIQTNMLNKLHPGRTAEWRVKQLITANALLGQKPTIGIKYPTLVKLALVDKLIDIVNITAMLLLPDSEWLRFRYKGDASIFHHWQHVYGVIKSGN